LDPASLTKEERVRYENLRNVRDVPLERAIDILTALRMLGAEGITRFLQAMPTNELDAATAAVPANVSTETVDEIEH
jgi:hypothetical protein